MGVNKDFLPQRGNYENLAVYKLATCIDAVTYHFANTYFSKKDRTIATRQYCKNNSDPKVFVAKMKERSDETIANIALTMIHQFDYLMVRLIESIKRRFLEQGGIKEQMYRARKGHRDKQ